MMEDGALSYLMALLTTPRRPFCSRKANQLDVVDAAAASCNLQLRKTLDVMTSGGNIQIKSV